MTKTSNSLTISQCIVIANDLRKNNVHTFVAIFEVILGGKIEVEHLHDRHEGCRQCVQHYQCLSESNPVASIISKPSQMVVPTQLKDIYSNWISPKQIGCEKLPSNG